ncbi:hypothetical protein LZ31DRAFT_558580 [Colletotrichum somersetense]|nr:hypothetical protein LZ31DRAFT_558580 [Colletotrichum somersetense]
MTLTHSLILFLSNLFFGFWQPPRRETFWGGYGDQDVLCGAHPGQDFGTIGGEGGERKEKKEEKKETSTGFRDCGGCVTTSYVLLEALTQTPRRGTSFGQVHDVSRAPMPSGLFPLFSLSLRRRQLGSVCGASPLPPLPLTARTTAKPPNYVFRIRGTM